jgi:hypothetical protein
MKWYDTGMQRKTTTLKKDHLSSLSDIVKFCADGVLWPSVAPAVAGELPLLTRSQNTRQKVPMAASDNVTDNLFSFAF